MTQASFGFHHEEEVTAYTLTNRNHCQARLITFGARLVEMHVPDKHGETCDIVLGFDTLAPYETSNTYFGARSEEHTSELQSLMRISYAVFCLKKKKHNIRTDYIQLLQGNMHVSST